MFIANHSSIISNEPETFFFLFWIYKTNMENFVNILPSHHSYVFINGPPLHCIYTFMIRQIVKNTVDTTDNVETIIL